MSESTSWVPSVAAAYNGNGDVDYRGVPGVRFVPTYQELIVHYLQRKLRGEPLPTDAVHDGHDVYAEHPQKLVAKLGEGVEGVWYVFSPRERKYPRGMRPNRGIACEDGDEGHWKATNNAKVVLGGVDGKQVVGTSRGLTFHTDIYEMGSNGRRRRVKNRSKPTKWKMVELVCSDSCMPCGNNTAHEPMMLLNHWVLCKITDRSLRVDTDHEMMMAHDGDGDGDEQDEQPTSDAGGDGEAREKYQEQSGGGGAGTQAAPFIGGAVSHGNQQPASTEAPLPDDGSDLGTQSGAALHGNQQSASAEVLLLDDGNDLDAQWSVEADFFGTLPMPSIFDSDNGIGMTYGGQHTTGISRASGPAAKPDGRSSELEHHACNASWWRSGRIDPTLSNF